MRSGTTTRGIGRTLLIVLTAFALLLIVAALLYAEAFGPMKREPEPNRQFVVTPDETLGEIADSLTENGYVRGAWIFELAYLRASDGHAIRPGGYEISPSMDAWTIASQLVQAPYFAWVKVPVGVRKEQIGDQLSEALGWNAEERAAWDAATGSSSPNYIEGVYFPDTYLIPTDEPPALIAERMRNRFKEVFAPYADEAVKKKVAWPQVLTIASLIQREAGSVEDMSIISGIIQKRLAVGMPLALDASLQYMTGNADTGWWPSPKPAGTYPDSPFNTYKQKGLPPHPIAEPGLAAIEAALNPIATNCLFYIHDNRGVMHCSPTYAGQLANINKYLP